MESNRSTTNTGRGSRPGVGSPARGVRMRGTLLWFNESDDVGALRTEDGERLDVPGAAFPPDEKPVGRCAGTVIEFDSINGVVTNVAFVPDMNPRRARMRHRR